MEEIQKEIEEIQKLIFIYNKNNDEEIEEIKINEDFSKIIIEKINYKI